MKESVKHKNDCQQMQAFSNQTAALVRKDFSKVAGSADGIIHQITALLAAQLGREPTAAEIEMTANIFGDELNLARWTKWLNGKP